MTSEELLEDIRYRIDCGAEVLREQSDIQLRSGDVEECRRLLAKREGLLVVKDWLRSYEQAEMYCPTPDLKA